MKIKNFLIFLIVLSLLLASCSFTTANVSDIKMASEIDDNNVAVEVTSKFITTSPVIYLTGVLNNAPSDTKLTAQWYYLETDPKTFIDSALIYSENIDSNFNFSLSIPDAGWPVGNYEVILLIDDNEVETVSFVVE